MNKMTSRKERQGQIRSFKSILVLTTTRTTNWLSLSLYLPLSLSLSQFVCVCGVCMCVVCTLCVCVSVYLCIILFVGIRELPGLEKIVGQELREKGSPSGATYYLGILLILKTGKLKNQDA